MGNHTIDCDYCGRDTRGLSGVRGCDTLNEASKCIEYKETNAASVSANDNRPMLEYPAQARAMAINDLVSYFHGKSAGNGWWPESMRSNPLVVSNKLALIHSEISEAMEGDRKNAMDDKLPHRKMIEVELGDALIRICDLAGFLNLDLGGATMEKDAYNDNRADHKTAARQAVGGKAY